MDHHIPKNLAAARLLLAMTDSQTTMTLSAGHGDRFPDPSIIPYWLTIFYPSGTNEVVEVTGKSGDVLTIVREEQNTTGVAWTVGAYVWLNMTEGHLNEITAAITALEAGAGPGGGTISSWKDAVLAFSDVASLVETLGNRYILTETSGGFIENYIYEYNGASWDEEVITKGDAAYVASDLYFFDGINWLLYSSIVPYWQSPILNTASGAPGSPNEGDRYLAVGTDAEWPFLGHIYTYTDGAWQSTPPLGGMAVLNRTDGSVTYYSGSSWKNLGDYASIDYVDNQDIATLVSANSYTDGAIHTQGTDTTLGAQAENLDMNTHKIVGVVDPTTDQEAATKKYVDDSITNAAETFYHLDLLGQGGYPVSGASGCDPVEMLTLSSYNFWGLAFPDAAITEGFWQFSTPLLPASPTYKIILFTHITSPIALNAQASIVIREWHDTTFIVRGETPLTSFSCDGTNYLYAYDITTSFTTTALNLQSNRHYTLQLKRDGVADSLAQDFFVRGISIEIWGDM